MFIKYIIIQISFIVLRCQSGFALRDASETPPVIVAHRGASEVLPEHSLSAYELASAMGADVIECDVTITKDKRAVCMHSLDLAEVTNIADLPRFADRRANATVYGHEYVNAYLVNDFTYDELQTLRLTQRFLAYRSAAFDHLYHIPTLSDFLQLAPALRMARPVRLSGNFNEETDDGVTANETRISTVYDRVVPRALTVMIESKLPQYHHSIGLDIEAIMIADLAEAGYGGNVAPSAFPVPLIIESFERDSLLRFESANAEYTLVQLVGHPGEHLHEDPTKTYAEMLSEEGLRSVRVYASGVGLPREWIFPFEEERRQLGEDGSPQPTDIVPRIHAADLFVYVWTLRIESQSYEMSGFRSFRDELLAYNSALIDGIFTDSPDVAVDVYYADMRPMPPSPDAHSGDDDDDDLASVVAHVISGVLVLASCAILLIVIYAQRRKLRTASPYNELR